MQNLALDALQKAHDQELKLKEQKIQEIINFNGTNFVDSPKM